MLAGLRASKFAKPARPRTWRAVHRLSARLAWRQPKLGLGGLGCGAAPVRRMAAAIRAAVFQSMAEG